MTALTRILLSLIVGGCLAGTHLQAEEAANDPAAPHAPGIYYYRELNGQRTMARLKASSFGNTKQMMSWWGEKTNTKAVIQGGHAVLQIDESRPTFYFYFGTQATGLGETASLSPDDYSLSSMEVHDNESTRRLIIGKASPYGGKSVGADKKTARNFKSTPVSPGVFKVTLDQDLAAGEYCFFRPVVGANSFFDFGIRSQATGQPAR